MRALFQTGTSITSENMNLAHLANGNPGVLLGCEVYEDGEYLVVSKGCVQFSDGLIVYLDGTDKVKHDALAHNEYYLYIVRYGNDFALEIKMVLPEYENIVLANVFISSENDIKIINTKKSTAVEAEKIIDGVMLNPIGLIYDESALTLAYNNKDFILYTTHLLVVVNRDSSLGFPFTYPNFNVSNIRLKAKLSSDTSLKLAVLSNGNTIYINDGIINQSSFDENDEYTFNLQDALASLKSGDCCCIKLMLSQSTQEENASSDIDIYSITLQT